MTDPELFSSIQKQSNLLSLFKEILARFKIIKFHRLITSKSWVVVLLTLVIAHNSSFKPLLIALLLSPWQVGNSVKDKYVLFARNLLGFSGILWALHSILGMASVKSLSIPTISITIQFVAIQIVSRWGSSNIFHLGSKKKELACHLGFYLSLMSVFLFAFSDFSARLATFLLGWDHLNGHLWLTSQVNQEGYIRTDPDDFIGIYPKGQFPLILSFVSPPFNFQNSVQGIFLIEIFLVIGTVFTVNKILSENNSRLNSGSFVSFASSVTAAPLLLFFVFYGWTSLLVAVCALVILARECYLNENKVGFQSVFFLGLAAIQAWTLLAPTVCVLIFIFICTWGICLRYKLIFISFFVAINLPSVFAIISFNGLEQVEEGFSSSSRWFFVLFFLTGFFVLYFAKWCHAQSSLKAIVICTYLEAMTIWIFTSLSSEITYYALKLFLVSLVLLVPFYFHKTISIIPFPKIRVLISICSIFYIFGMSQVPGSPYSYFNFLVGNNLESNWLASTVANEMSKNSHESVVLHSNYLIDMRNLLDIGKRKNPDLFAFDGASYCELRVEEKDLKLIQDPGMPQLTCKSL
jgi:hypothetical protein